MSRFEVVKNPQFASPVSKNSNFEVVKNPKFASSESMPQSSPENYLKNALYKVYEGVGVPLAALEKTGRGIGDVEWEGLHKLGNLLGLSHGPAQKYSQKFGSPEKSLGLPETSGYKSAVNITQGLMGGAIPGGLISQMGIGSLLDPTHPLTGATFGAAGVGAGKALHALGGFLRTPLEAVKDKLNPSDKGVQAAASKWMEHLPALRERLKNIYEPGYDSLKVVGKEPVHEHPIEGGYFDETHPYGRENPLTVESSFPDAWLDEKDKLFPSKLSPVHDAWEKFIKNPTLESADNFKEALNKEYPKETDKNLSAKKNFIKIGKNVIRNEFISPALARLDAQEGTKLWDKYRAADPAYSKEIENFGKNNDLDVATSGGAYDPDEYKEFYNVLEKAVKKGKVPVGSPVHVAAKEIKNAMKRYNNKLSSANTRGIVGKGAIGTLGALAAVPGIPGVGAQISSYMTKPLAQILAQKYGNE